MVPRLIRNTSVDKEERSGVRPPVLLALQLLFQPNYVLSLLCVQENVLLVVQAHEMAAVYERGAED